jgi:hypothetical protein
MYLTNKYSRWYYNIIKNSKNRILTAYSERHHIIPRSLGGNDSLENIAILTAREHFICHWLLVKMTTGRWHEKMVFALNMMNMSTRNQQRYSSYITGKVYEKYKIEDSKIKSRLYKGISRNTTKYQFCHINGRVEKCTILELSQKYNIPRHNVGHLVKKEPGKHHARGWSVNTPMHTICRNELYTGAGGPNYDNTIYYFQHKNVMFEQCTKYELFTKYNLTRNGIYAMCDGTQKTSQGWSLQAR